MTFTLGKIALVALAACGALATTAGVGNAAPATGFTCPANQFYPGDVTCVMSTGPGGYAKGDWVAVHVHTVGGQLRSWADGWDPNTNVRYYVELSGGGETELTEVKQGGNPPGVSIGDVITAHATAQLYEGTTLVLTAST
jgi:hypothetical protein